MQGWGGLGEGLDLSCLPDHVFVLEAACPHDWLFPCCAAVVHHGGAGTTAAGLKAGDCGQLNLRACTGCVPSADDWRCAAAAATAVAIVA